MSEAKPSYRLRASHKPAPIGQPAILRRISTLLGDEFGAKPGKHLPDLTISDTDLIRLLGRVRDLFQIRLNLGFLQSPFVQSKTLTPRKLSFVTYAFLHALTEHTPQPGQSNQEKFKLRVLSRHTFDTFRIRDLIPDSADDIVEKMRDFLFEHFSIDPFPDSKIRNWEIEDANLRYLFLWAFYQMGVILAPDPQVTLQQLGQTIIGILSARTERLRRKALSAGENLYHLDLTDTHQSGWIISPLSQESLLLALRRTTRDEFRRIFQDHLKEGPLHIAPQTPHDMPGSFTLDGQILTIKRTDTSRLL